MTQLFQVVTQSFAFQNPEEIEGVKSIVTDIFIQSCGNCTWLQTMIADPEKTRKFLEDKKLM